TPEYFRVLGVKLVRGRLFTDGDRQGAPPVAILNESAARRFFGSTEALGATIGFNGDRTVIGIVADTSFAGPERDTQPEGYLPLMQMPGAYVYVLVRATGSVAGVTGSVTAAVADVVPGEQAKPGLLRDYFWRLTAERRFSVAVMAV